MPLKVADFDNAKSLIEQLRDLQQTCSEVKFNTTLHVGNTYIPIDDVVWQYAEATLKARIASIEAALRDIGVSI